MISTNDNSNCDNIATKLMLSIFKILGLMPYTLIINSPKSKSAKKIYWQNCPQIQFSSSRLGCVYNLCLILAQIRMLVPAIELAFNDEYSDESPLGVTIQVAASAFGNSVLFAVWLMLGFRQKSAVRLLNRLLSLDSAIFFPNENYHLESSGCFFGLVFLANIFVWTGLLLTHQLAFHMWILKWFIIIVPSTIITGFVTEYIYLIKLIEKRFRALNEALLDNFSHRLFVMGDEELNYCFPSKIAKIRRVHSNLYELASEISEWWSLPMLITVAYHSYTFICSAYWLVAPFVFTTLKQTNLSIVNSIFWLTSEMMPIAILASGVDNVTAEMKKTADVVRKLLTRSNTSQNDKIELKQFAIELLHRKIQFTACGFFPLNRTLVHSIFSMVATYLIILIQIQMASSKNSSQ